MSQKPLFVLILLITLDFVPSQTRAPIECGPRELFVWCMASHEATCSTPEFFGAWKCEGYCMCQYPYIRDHEGKCIPVEECPPRCPEASVFELCSKSSRQLCGKKEESQVEDRCIPGCSCLPDHCWEESSKSCKKIVRYTGTRRSHNIPIMGRYISPNPGTTF